MPGERPLTSREPLTVTVAGTSVRIPHRPAGLWIQHLDRLNTLAALLADPEDRDRLAGALMQAPAAVAELRAESLRILAAATGRKWYTAGRLLATSTDPEILGRLVLAGVDPWARSVGEWTAATYALLAKGQDEKGRMKLDFSLALPPPGWEDEWDDEQDDPAAIAAAVQTMQGL